MASAAGLTVRENALVVTTLAESVSWIVKSLVPYAVGVPVMAPLEALSVRPAGSVPTDTAHAYGVAPPVPVSVYEYAAPTWPPGSGEVLVITSAAGLTVSAKALVVWTLSESVSWMVKLVVP